MEPVCARTADKEPDAKTAGAAVFARTAGEEANAKTAGAAVFARTAGKESLQALRRRHHIFTHFVAISPDSRGEWPEPVVVDMAEDDGYGKSCYDEVSIHL